MVQVKNQPEKSLVLWTCTLVLIFALFSACGGSKKSNLDTAEGGEVNIDQLLGLEGQAEKTDSTKSPEEAEVLRLLGIEDDQGEKPAQPQKKNESSELKNDVQQLESQLSERDNTIQNLRSELAAKDEQLRQIQSRPVLETPPRTALESGTSTYNTSYRARYKDAYDDYTNRHFRQAIEKFSALISEDSNTSLSDNCQYWIGECYYALGNYAQAIAEFEKVYSYPSSNKIDASILKLGLSYSKMGNKELARAQFEQLIANYPKSDYVEMARNYLNNL